MGARMAAHRDTVERAETARDIHYFVVRRRRPRYLRREHGRDPAARVVEPASASLARPDWCILDIDPKGAAFARRGRRSHARSTRSPRRSSCRAYVKTSGSEGGSTCSCRSGGRCELRAVAAPRRADRAGRGGERGCATSRRSSGESEEARRQGLSRHAPERPRQAAGGALAPRGRCRARRSRCRCGWSEVNRRPAASRIGRSGPCRNGWRRGSAIHGRGCSIWNRICPRFSAGSPSERRSEPRPGEVRGPVAASSERSDLNGQVIRAHNGHMTRVSVSRAQGAALEIPARGSPRRRDPSAGSRQADRADHLHPGQSEQE